MEDEKIIIFTDLDGTLLDHGTYSYAEAEEALLLIKERNIPLVLCSSKTRDEIEVYRKKLSNNCPLISENGGAIFIPEQYNGLSCEYDRIVDGYLVIEIGAEYRSLKGLFEKIRNSTGADIKGITEFTIDEVIQMTGLDKVEAGLAVKREYSFPFVVTGDESEVEVVKREIESLGLNFTEGARFKHLMGSNDKGKAIDILMNILKEDQPEARLISVGLGDSLNDLPMLEAVDKPILVKKESGMYEERIKVDNLVYADGVGPIGWNKAVLGLLL